MTVSRAQLSLTNGLKSGITAIQSSFTDNSMPIISITGETVSRTQMVSVHRKSVSTPSRITNKSYNTAVSAQLIVGMTTTVSITQPKNEGSSPIKSVTTAIPSPFSSRYTVSCLQYGRHSYAPIAIVPLYILERPSRSSISVLAVFSPASIAAETGINLKSSEDALTNWGSVSNKLFPASIVPPPPSNVIKSTSIREFWIVGAAPAELENTECWSLDTLL